LETDGGFEHPTPDGSATGRRALWGALDQGLYGLTNFALAVVVASSVSQKEFGAFSAVLIVYTLSIGVVEGLTAEVFTVLYSTGPEIARREALAAAAGCAVACGAAMSVAAVVVWSLVPGPVVEALPAFAVVVPTLYLQDLWRFSFFAASRPGAAVLNDATWALVQVAALLAVRLTHHTTVSAFVVAWGAGAVAGSALGILQSRVVPRPLMAWDWLRSNWGLGGRFAGEFLTLFGSAQVVLGVLGATAGLAQLARLRAGQVLFSPIQGLLNAVRLSVTSLAVEVRANRPRRLGTFIARLSVGLGVLAVLSGVVALLLPDEAGQAMLGDSWRGARSVLLPLTILNTALAISLGPLTGLRAVRASRRSFRARALTAIMVVIFGTAGVFLGGAVAAAWGIAVAGTVGCGLMAWEVRVALRDLGDDGS